MLIYGNRSVRSQKKIKTTTKNNTHSSFKVDQWSGFFENHETTTFSALILCVAVCVCDAMNKIIMCGKSVSYVTSQLFLLFIIGKERTCMAAPGRELKFKANKYVCCLYTKYHTKHAAGTICTYMYVFRHTCIFVVFPLITLVLSLMCSYVKQSGTKVTMSASAVHLALRTMCRGEKTSMGRYTRNKS